MRDRIVKLKLIFGNLGVYVKAVLLNEIHAGDLGDLGIK